MMLLSSGKALKGAASLRSAVFLIHLFVSQRANERRKLSQTRSTLPDIIVRRMFVLGVKIALLFDLPGFLGRG